MSSKYWRLNLDAIPPIKYKYCDFNEYVILEAAWLPYEQDGKIELKPSIVMKTAKRPEVSIYKVDKDLPINASGVFPSQELKTLMSVNAVKMVMKNTQIDPHEVDKELDEAIHKHVELGNKRRIVLKRWIEGTYFYDVFDHYPILNVMGVSQSGKSRILKIILATAYHADSFVDPTDAVMFRSKEEDRVTLCWDEAEYLNIPAINQTLRTLINASYSKGAYVHRYDELGDGKRVKRRFNLYSPMAIVGISGLYGVSSSRAIQIITERANRDFPVARIEDYEGMRDELYVLRFNKAFEVRKIYKETDVSSIVTGRFEELFKPLFVMTKVFGNETEYGMLSEWAKMYQQAFNIEAASITDEEQVLTTLTQLTPYPDDWYSIKELTEEVNVQHARHLRYQKVSEILKRVGLTERRKVKGKAQFRATPKTLRLIAARLGLELGEEEGDGRFVIDVKG